jgi:hypothetical protein
MVPAAILPQNDLMQPLGYANSRSSHFCSSVDVGSSFHCMGGSEKQQAVVTAIYE